MAQSNQGLTGFATLGEALGGGAEVTGANAYDNGLRVGATTTDALAQAKDRIQKTQAASQAAASLRSPALQQQLNITPEQGELAATQAEQGMDVEHVFNGLKTNQETNMRATIASGGDAGRRAAIALAPASGEMHGLGDNGTFIDPFSKGYSSDAAPGPNNTPVSVSPLQAGATQAKTNLDNANAAAAPIKATADQTRADRPQGNSAGPKLQPGYQWDVETDKANQNYGNVRTQADGVTPNQIPNPNAGKSSGREMQMTGRVLQGAHQAATDIENMNMLPRGSTTGVMGVGAAPGHSLFQTTTDNLRNKLSTEDTQRMATSVLGLARGAATVETNGLVPNGTFTSSLEQYAPRDGDTEGTMLWKQANVRQIFENGYKTMAANPRTPLTMLDDMGGVIKQIQTAIPYTPRDVIDFGKQPTGTQLDAFLKGRKPAAAAAPIAAPTAAPATGGAPVSLDDYLKSQGH